MKRLNYVLNMSKYPNGYAYLFSYLTRSKWGRQYNLDCKVIRTRILNQKK